MKARGYLLIPAYIWYGIFILSPLLLIMFVSFMSRGTYGGLELRLNFLNYIEIFRFGSLSIFFKTILLAGFTGVFCTLMGLLISWLVISRAPEKRTLYLGLIVLPFLINSIIRLYALKSFIGFDGPLQGFLKILGIPFDPFAFTGNTYLVAVGMLINYLPFAVLPIYSALHRFDFTLLEAAIDLGCGKMVAFLKVVVPGIRNSLLAAFILIFVPALGEYLIPDLLGGAKTMYLGNALSELFLKSRNWPMGSAMAMSMIIAFSLIYWLGIKFNPPKRQTAERRK